MSNALTLLASEIIDYLLLASAFVAVCAPLACIVIFLLARFH